MLKALKRFAIRLPKIRRLNNEINSLKYDKFLNTKNQSVGLVDVFDLHPVAISRNLNILKCLDANGVRPVVFQRTWGFSKTSNPKVSVLWLIYEQLLTYFLYRRYENLKVNYLKRDKELESSIHLKDLLLDGIMRYEGIANIDDIEEAIFEKHARCAVSIYKSIQNFFAEQQCSICITGHKTYYLRGILYRLSGLNGKGLYIGPRFNSLITKRLTPSNYNDCYDYIRSETDFFQVEKKELRIEGWLRDIRQSQVNERFISPFKQKIPLLAFHCWVDDNYKGRFNIFGSHFSAAVEMSKWLAKNNIPFLYKLHPHNDNYGVSHYDVRFKELVIKNNIQCLDVSGIQLSALADSISLVVTGNGSIGPESEELEIPFLCYADAPYYVEKEWAYTSRKEVLFEKLKGHQKALSSATLDNQDTYYNLEFENDVDPSFLAAHDADYFDYGKVDSAARWAGSVLNWYFNGK
jgi:hypothetical protein